MSLALTGKGQTWGVWGLLVPGKCPGGADLSLEAGVCSFSIYWDDCLYLVQDCFSYYENNSIAEVWSARKSPFTEKASWHQEKSCPAN